MKRSPMVVVFVLALAVAVAGCAKKMTDQANLSGTGFESVGMPGDLAQLPQAAVTGNQQGAVEVLPVDPAPVTPPVMPSLSAPTNFSASSESLLRDKQIQTALQNAGFYTGSIDGKIGPMTRKAIQAFQTSNGLKSDGKVGAKTWAALQPFLTGGASTTASQGNSAPVSGN